MQRRRGRWDVDRRAGSDTFAARGLSHELGAKRAVLKDAPLVCRACCRARPRHRDVIGVEWWQPGRRSAPERSELAHVASALAAVTASAFLAAVTGAAEFCIRGCPSEMCTPHSLLSESEGSPVAVARRLFTFSYVTTQGKAKETQPGHESVFVVHACGASVDLPRSCAYIHTQTSGTTRTRDGRRAFQPKAQR